LSNILKEVNIKQFTALVTRVCFPTRWRWSGAPRST